VNNRPQPRQPVIFEIEQNCKDGSSIWTSNNVRFLKGPEKKSKRILGVTRYISIQKLAETQKVPAQQIAAEHEKNALVGKIAHDFNNILGVVMGNT